MITRRGLLASAVAAVTLRAQFANPFTADGAKWNLLFPRGQWHGANLAPIGGSIDLSSGLLEEMVANWKAAGSPKLPIRVTHRHLDDDVPAKDRLELERAVGFLTDLRATADGLEALTEWNDAGRHLVESGAFAFWSPEWQPRHVDRRSGEVKGWWLSGTALTNDPFFNEMPPVAAANSTVQPAAQEQHPMNEEQLKLLRAALGLSITATVEEVLAAASKRTGDITSLTAEVAKLKSADTKALVAEAVKAAVEPMQAELAATKKQLLEREVDALIATAKRGDGKTGRGFDDAKVRPVLLKLIASESSQAEGLKAAKEYLEAIPATVPVVPVGTTPSGDGAPLTASVAQEKLVKLQDELLASNKSLSRSEARDRVLAAHPDIAKAARPASVPTHTQEA